jgi:hypothetical protein
MLGQPINGRAEVEGGGAGPIRQGATVDLDAGARQDLALAVKRQVVRELRDQHVCNGALPRRELIGQNAKALRHGIHRRTSLQGHRDG